jgi:uncharacterized membrane protein
MVPFFLLVGLFGLFVILGSFGIPVAFGWWMSLRLALSGMFLLTASAHWGKRRADLIRMVPPRLPAAVLVTVTGIFEVLGALGLLLPLTARIAALGLFLMLLAVFPANIRAAREYLTIGGRPAPPLPVRTLLQIVFLGATLAVVTMPAK